MITASEPSAWRHDVPLLLLGGWCGWNLDTESLKGLDIEVAHSYGWEEGQREADYHNVWELIERLLPEVAGMLNQYHGTGHSVRYWRIMLGTWLYKFTMIMFNRWATVQHVLGNYNVSGAEVVEFPREQLVPVGYLGFARLYRLDSWNQAIYGRILKDYSKVPCNVMQAGALDNGEKSDRQSFTPPPVRTMRLGAKHLVGRVVQRFAKLLTCHNDALFVATYLPFWQECKLQLSMWQIPVPRLMQLPPEVPPDFAVRERFCLDVESHTGFEQFVRKLITEQLPTCYLEGYRALSERAAGMPWPSRPPFIFTANSFDGDEIFKAWTAAKVEEGIPYIIGQHGANYGAGMFAPSEMHEVATADRYLTWGWQEDTAKHHPVAALPMVGKSASAWEPQGGLLLVERSGGNREMLWDETPALRRYMGAQFNFVSNLSNEASERLTVRLSSSFLMKSWSEDVLWKKRFPQIRLDNGTRPIAEQISRSRLTVFSYESTGVLESLAGNVPILVFYDTQDFPLRPSARPYYECLKTAGIFHETAGSAAVKVNEIWHDVHGWWERGEVQEARKTFCDHFARMPKYPLRELKRTLLRN